jgi:hypothetical protein
MPGGTQGVGEAPDMVEAIGGEIAVVDEEDVHAAEVCRKESIGASDVGPGRAQDLPACGLGK